MDRSSETTGRPRVVIADDNPAMRAKVMALLKPECDVLDEVADGAALVNAVHVTLPDIAVVDITMPRVGGMEAVRRLTAEGIKLKVVFLTVHEDPDFAGAAHESGACGFVVKSRMATDLLPAIHSAIAGEWFCSLGPV